ncbi:MAG TPA: sulfotransferase [Bryobacteraceae bacterium]|jgi:hypothetical protein
MGDLVFLSGDFCSGSTLLFTLFRETGEYHCLYEPLHPLLREYLIWPLRVYEHHYFVRDYFKEYKGFDRVSELFNPEWATRKLFLSADDDAGDLYRYISYLIDAASARRGNVLLKFNRTSFRLPWLRARFPQAKIIHIHRDKQSQWKSIVARGQEHAGREDIGQNSPDFQGFNIAVWCEDLKPVFPELAADRSETGFERFSKLYDRSLEAHRANSDISIEYRALCKDFEATCGRMFDAVGCKADVASLKPLIIQPESQKRPAIQPAGFSATAGNLIDRMGRKYAKLRVRSEAERRKNGR